MKIPNIPYLSFAAKLTAISIIKKYFDDWKKIIIFRILSLCGSLFYL